MTTGDHAVISWVAGATVATPFMTSIIGMLGGGAKTPIDKIIGMSSGVNITTARNQAVDKFLTETTAPWLLTVDTDMVFRPDALDRLIEHAHPETMPVLGALCHQLDGDGRPQPVLFAIDETRTPQRFRRITDWPKGEIIQACTGAAFLLVHRDVYQDVAAYNGCPGAPWYREIPTANWLVQLGEDVSFMLACGATGHPPHVDTSIGIGHCKPTMFGTVE